MTGFIIVYVTTMGPVSWLYAAETSSDIGLGVSTAVFMSLSLVTSLLKDAFIVYPSLHFILTGISLCAFVMVFLLVPETKSKSDRLKK